MPKRNRKQPATAVSPRVCSAVSPRQGARPRCVRSSHDHRQVGVGKWPAGAIRARRLLCLALGATRAGPTPGPFDRPACNLSQPIRCHAKMASGPAQSGPRHPRSAGLHLASRGHRAAPPSRADRRAFGSREGTRSGERRSASSEQSRRGDECCRLRGRESNALGLGSSAGARRRRSADTRESTAPLHPGSLTVQTAARHA